MKIALDTNRYTDAARGHPDVVRVLNTTREIWLPFIVLGELRAGFACGNAGRANEAHLARFLNSPRVRIVFADEGTTRLYAILFADLRSRGTPLPTNDIWIAALTLQYDLILFSRDEHFQKLPQIARI